MKLFTNFLLFLLINFGALAIGGWFTGTGVSSNWYESLHKAPWSPPGWVFGAAWTTIMICFTVYMAILIKKAKRKRAILGLFAIQFVLNVIWNPLFFYFRDPIIALIPILALTLLMLYFTVHHHKKMKGYSLLVLPYFVWLCIASSLNLYIVIYN